MNDSGYKRGDRIGVPVHYDSWMRGDRNATVTGYRNGKPGQSDYLTTVTDSGRRLRLWRPDWPYIRP